MLDSIKRAFGPEPTPAWPVTLQEDQLQPLGELRGRLWFTVAGDAAHEYELLKDRRPLRDADTRARLSDGSTYVAGTAEATRELDGSTYLEAVWYETNRHPAGTFARGGKDPAPVQKGKRKPTAAVDGLAVLPALAPRPAEIFRLGPEREETIEPLPYGVEPIMIGRAPRTTARLIEAQPVQRGAERILSLLGRKNVRASLVPCRYGCHIVTETERGALTEPARDVIDRTAPLLAPAIGCNRSPLADVAANGHCHHPVHKGDHKPVAVTIGPGGVYGAPLCAECVR